MCTQKAKGIKMRLLLIAVLIMLLHQYYYRKRHNRVDVDEEVTEEHAVSFKACEEVIEDRREHGVVDSENAPLG